MKKQLFLLLMMLSPAVAMAYDAEIDGIYYSFNGTEATVTSGDNKYSGDIVIPAVATYNETEYSVVSIGDHAFDDCRGLTSVTIPSSVTSIGEMAFAYCSSLTSVTISNGVTTILQSAFQNCDGLESIKIPGSVTYVSGSAFNNCGGLTTITVDDGNVSYVSEDGVLFNKAKTIIVRYPPAKSGTAYVIPYNVTRIEECAFQDCCSLTSVTIPNSVSSIEDKAFAACSGLISITIPNGVTSIDWGVFEDCSGLVSVTIPHSVTRIENVAFIRCSSLTDIYCYAEDVPTTDSYTFFQIPIGDITLHVPAASIDAYETTSPWSGFKDIVSLNIDFADANVKALCVANWDTDGDGELSEAEAAAVTSLGGVFSDNSQITSFNELHYFTGLNAIESWAFDSCTGLTSITIPSSVGNIKEFAFDGCSGLSTITIPNSVGIIEHHAFNGCSSLTYITIPESVWSIGENPFAGCSGLTAITVEEGNTHYDSRNNCNSIIETSSNTLIAGCKNTTIPNSVTSIGSLAFSYCSGLTSITIPNSVTSIGVEAFEGCSGLTSITIPNSVTNIGNYPFSCCSGLTSVAVEEGNAKYDSRNNCNAIIETSSNTLLLGCKNTTIPNSVTSIGNGAFVGCNGLTSIEIPNSVTSIGDGAFSSCSGLTSITIPNSVTNIGQSAFMECESLTMVTIPNSITTIGDYLFFWCTSLTSITIPHSVTTIGDHAFWCCFGLTSITIPNSVTSIGFHALGGCSGRTDVYCYAENVPTTDSHAFDNTPISDVTLHVLESSIDDYQATSPWSDFKEIVGISQAISMQTSSGYPRTMKGYSSEQGLDFTDVTDVKAYIAVGFTGDKKVLLARVDIVPANTGMILRTDNPGVAVDVPITYSDVYYANLLKPALNNVTIQPTETVGGVDFTNLMVGTDSSTGQLGFITFSNAVTRSNNCYLSVPTHFFQSAATARQGGLDMIFVDSETTTDIQSLMESGIITDDIYDLQGRKVTATKKGLYIRNGKKVYIK